MDKRFDGLTAWVTGASSGIGRALAMELASRGADVAVLARRADRLEDVAAAVRGQGRRCLALPVDVTDEDAMQAAAAQVAAEWGRLDVVVANAGFGISAPFEEVTAAQWRQQMEVNVVGVAITLRAALPHLKRTRGRAALVSSVMGKLAMAGSAPYCASKFALVGMADSLFQELAGTGVSVTNILPGLVESEIGQVDNRGTFRADWKDRRPQQLMWKTDRAARSVADAIHARKREHVFTGHGKVGAFLGQHIPGLIYPLMARMNLRGAEKPKAESV